MSHSHAFTAPFSWKIQVNNHIQIYLLNAICGLFPLQQDQSIVVKNSPSRNLHRLLNTLAFISAIFKQLQLGKSLKDAVSGNIADNQRPNNSKLEEF